MRTRRWQTMLVVLLAAVDCGHDWNAADAADGDALSPAEDGDGWIETGDAVSDGEADAAGDDGADGNDGFEVADDGAPDGPPPACWNGVVDPGEECDDGNDRNEDECLNVCSRPWCGDGYVREEVEECDPGGLGVVPGCDADCTLAACGDGTTGIVPGLVDGFEGGTLASPPWENGTPYGFAPVAGEAAEGAWAVGSTNAGVRDSTAWVQTRVATSGEVCFWFMGESADRGRDEFRFLVDGSEQLSETRAQPTWVRVCREVTPGVHTLRWEYARGNRGSTAGIDAYFIDGVDTGGPFVEECDDANLDNTDACLDTCRAASCGDGYVWADREECDGNSRTCTTSCRSIGAEACGRDCSWSGLCSPPAESCNGFDDDCDGVADETYTCRAGASRACTNACGRSGTESCSTVSCTWNGACCLPVELCDCGTCDDDCDGVTDEGCVPC
ncbi:MAG: hypothetical protein GYA57_07850 [Myxococcales bacterium]|nr:hypothetical protein [Myxococcales bacterium]